MNTMAYLLGAGASRAALPITGEMELAFRSFQGQYEGAGDSFVDGSLPERDKAEYPPNKKEFFAALSWAGDIARDYQSVDAYARERFLAGDTAALKRIKAVISACFIALQAQRPIDPRYRMFLAELLERPDSGFPQVPQAVKIITWNYDTQLEAAYFGFCGDNDQVLNHITGNHDQIIRLNGYCGSAVNRGHGTDFSAPWLLRGPAALPHAYKLYHELMDPKVTQIIDLWFAFEHDSEAAFIQQLTKKLSDVSTLVMIGYSMPRLNREIDAKLFKAMPNLRTIYYQVRPDYEEELKERLSIALHKTNGPEIVYKRYLDKFHIPYTV